MAVNKIEFSGIELQLCDNYFINENEGSISVSSLDGVGVINLS